MIHAREDYSNIQDVNPDPRRSPIPEDEPVFILRGQDRLAAGIVRIYAELSERDGADPELVEACRRQADRMEAWPVKKRADMAPGLGR
jgi:hypothetical protein